MCAECAKKASPSPKWRNIRNRCPQKRKKGHAPMANEQYMNKCEIQGQFCMRASEIVLPKSKLLNVRMPDFGGFQIFPIRIVRSLTSKWLWTIVIWL